VVTETPKIDLGSESKPAPEAPQGVGVNATFVTNLSAGARNPAANRIEQNGQRVHIVAGGDTLAKISTMYYGTPGRWADILAANRDVLGENNNLVIGRALRIP
jgi:nucleoid-associated protein YgaU